MAGQSGQSGQTGWQLEAAFAAAPDEAWVRRLTEVLDLLRPGALRYADGRRGHQRLLRLQGEGAEARLQAWLRLSASEDGAWLDAWWREGRPVASLGRLLLAPRPATAQPAGSPVVCQCLGVREAQIQQRLHQCQDLTPDERLQAVQGALKCGTQCGSCLPQLRRLARTSLEMSP